ncbi:hypothetical protein ACIBQ1_48925 [Nonomuraea sp. NPDC050153]|uniref:hypothetical protein n=1 Tax=Nonomuraea sp. NPDC050153 TaxID=3364359 RepID=UPI0037ABB103
MDARSPGTADLVEAPSMAIVVDVMRASTVAAWMVPDDATALDLRAADIDDERFDAPEAPGLRRPLPGREPA